MSKYQAVRQTLETDLRQVGNAGIGRRELHGEVPQLAVHRVQGDPDGDEHAVKQQQRQNQRHQLRVLQHLATVG